MGHEVLCACIGLENARSAKGSLQEYAISSLTHGHNGGLVFYTPMFCGANPGQNLNSA